MTGTSMRRVWALLASMVLLLVLSPAAATAATTTVNCSTGGDLRAALDAAGPGDSIIIRGTCVGNYSTDKSVTLQGRGGKPTLRGASGVTEPVLTVYANTEIVRLTIAGGSTTGIHVWSGELRLFKSTVRDNGGAGVNVFDITVGDADISNSTIKGNGGFGINNATDLLISKSTISGNGAGGVNNVYAGVVHGTITMVDSRIVNNGGTGFYNGRIATIRRSTIKGNVTTGLGGGIYNIGYGAYGAGDLTVIDSVVTRNTASDGGGIYNGYSPRGQHLFLENVKVRRNTPNDIVEQTP